MPNIISRIPLIRIKPVLTVDNVNLLFLKKIYILKVDKKKEFKEGQVQVF